MAKVPPDSFPFSIGTGKRLAIRRERSAVSVQPDCAFGMTMALQTLFTGMARLCHVKTATSTQKQAARTGP
jgi:hypothetical protein